VQINTIDVVKGQVPQTQSPWDFFFQPSPGGGEEREYRQPGLGSGVLVRRQGDKVYVLTNNHVVGEAEEIMVQLYDDRQFEAKLVGTDPRRDLAVIVFETKEEIPLALLGDSDKLQVGDLVLAVGNPFGFESTITSGIVSALGRKADQGSFLATFTDYIQTDAAINPGNSGGALVNLYGEVVGINTWIASRTGSYAGLGFAVPINNAKQDIEDFITKGRVEYGWLGVQIGDAGEQLYPLLRKNMDLPETGGAFVFNIFKGSPAQKAGIRPGDFIFQVNDVSIEDADHLTHVVGNMPPGDPSSFEVIRDSNKLTFTTKIAIRQEDKEITAQSKNLWPGMYVGNITDEVRKALSESKLPANLKGVIVRYVLEGTPAAIADFKPGDVIKKINDGNILNTKTFYRAITADTSKEYTMLVLRGEDEITVGLKK
ncbi:MAG TPA: Do family serine endopeptidase, partial [bacterium]|nr:Do family serine endopeptidase [bacterium]